MDETKENNEDNLCLITKEILEKDFIKLSCKHAFNYEAIFFDIIYQKKYNNLETQKLKKYQIKCPYCRTIQNGLLTWKTPYEKINNVNWPPSKWYKNNVCKFIFKRGNKKNTKCNNKCVNNYCKTHSFNKCCATISSGKRKGEICQAKAGNTHNDLHYCKRHFKLINNNNS